MYLNNHGLNTFLLLIYQIALHAYNFVVFFIANTFSSKKLLYEPLFLNSRIKLEIFSEIYYAAGEKISNLGEKN